MKNAHDVIEIKKLRTKYKYLYNHSPMGILTLNKKGIIIEANRTIVKKLSSRKKNLLKQSVFNFIDSKEKETFSLHLKKVFTNHNASSQHIITQMRGETGTIFYTQVKSVPLREVSLQNPILCQSFFSDITFWKQIEYEQKYQLEQKKKGVNYLEYLKCFSTFINKDIREEKLFKQATSILKSHFQPDILAMLILDKNKYFLETSFMILLIYYKETYNSLNNMELEENNACIFHADYVL